jgi:photosystem II stability/assembly factor-like uncharacterized protein
MKKLLLLFVFFTTLLAQSQDFWTEYSTSQTNLIEGVKCISIVDQNTTWLNMWPLDGSTNHFPRYAKTINGGTVWTSALVNLGADTNDLEIANICGVSSSVAYVAVYPIVSGIQGGIWKTADGGNTWARQASATFSNASSSTDLVHFWNANEGVAMGNAVNGYFEIYTTSNGGDVWTQVPNAPAIVPIDTQEYIVINTFDVNNNTIWVGTSFGRILKSVDKGLTWTVSQSPIPNFAGSLEYGKIAFTDLSNGLIQTSEYKLYKTIDGGSTWTELLYSVSRRNKDIAAVPGLPNAYIAIGNDAVLDFRGSSYTVDGGENWIDINEMDYNFVTGYVVEMLNSDYGFAGGFYHGATSGIFKWGGGAMLRQAHLTISAFSDDKAVSVYPNPTTGVVKISGININRIEVTDLTGKQITNATYNAFENINLNLEFLNSGIYMLRVNSDKGTSVFKVIKQ